MGVDGVLRSEGASLAIVSAWLGDCIGLGDCSGLGERNGLGDCQWYRGVYKKGGNWARSSGCLVEEEGALRGRGIHGQEGVTEA